jgi:hypothetical protein
VYATKLGDLKELLKGNTREADKGIWQKWCINIIDDFVKKIADNYDIDVITKSDKTTSWIFKDDRDYALKLEELSIKKAAEDKKTALEGGGGGTETTRMLLLRNKPWLI